MNESAPRERPILFSGSMIMAIMNSTKTQTRRIVKPVGKDDGFVLVKHDDGTLWPHRTGKRRHIPLRCPFGAPGDMLWVRETWGVGSRPDPWGGYDGIEYRADEAYLEDEHDLLDCHKVTTPDGVCLGDYESGWRPSIHMPRWASRIILEITDVRFEKVQDISESDAKAEGIQIPKSDMPLETLQGIGKADARAEGVPLPTGWGYRHEFAYLWDCTIGEGAWDWNPFVWVVSFSLLTV